jgi:ribonuclease-3
MSFVSRILKRLTPRGPGGIGSRGLRYSGDPVEAFQRVLGFRFTDIGLLRQALTHRSASSNDGDNSIESNERLEFLGDSVLGLVVNEHLFREYPRDREGHLTQMKSLLVSKPILSVKARDMDIGRYLFMSSGEEESGGRDRSSILADAFEAVIGAIYLDGGMEAARAFIEDKLMSGAREILKDRNHINYKSMLQELVQSEQKIHPQYRVTSEDGPDHEKVFTVAVIVGKRVLGKGKGKNKKQAQQEAARMALRSLGVLSNAPDIATAGGHITSQHRNHFHRRMGFKRGRRNSKLEN